MTNPDWNKLSPVRILALAIAWIGLWAFAGYAAIYWLLEFRVIT